MKVVGFIGSRRTKGNTATLVDTILEGVREKGIDAKKFILDDSQIRGCQSCYACLTEDRCSIDDQMQGLYEEIKQSDALIIGSPIYFGQISGQTKSFIDRLFRFTHNPKRLPKALKPTIMAITHGNPNDKEYDEYIQYIQQYLAYAGLSVIHTYSIGNCYVSAEPVINNYQKKLESARRLGAMFGEFVLKVKV